MNTEKLEKIRALLAKAESTHFEHEARAFTAKAQELMTKWSIDETMLSSARHEDLTVDQSFIWIDANEYRGPKLDVLSVVALHNDCQLVLFHQGYVEKDGKRKRVFKVAIIGTATDREFVEILYTSLMLQAEHELLKPEVLAKMQFECEQAGHSIRWRNSFVRSYAISVGERLSQAKKRVVEQTRADHNIPSNTMALVLVGKTQQIERRKSELYPNLRAGRSSSAGRSTGSSSALGYQAGKRADLGNPKVSVGSRKAIS